MFWNKPDTQTQTVIVPYADLGKLLPPALTNAFAELAETGRIQSLRLPYSARNDNSQDMALAFAHVLQQAGASDDNRIAGLHGSRSELPYSEIEGYYRQNSLLEAKLSGKPHAPRLSLTLNEGVQRENHSPLLQPVLKMQGPLGQSGWAVNSLSVGIAHPPAIVKNVRAAFDILSKFDLAERLHQAFNPIAVAATTALNEHFLSRVELNLMNRKRSGYLVSEP